VYRSVSIARNAVVRRDVELAQSVLATDDQIFRELLTYMTGDSSVVFPAFELILVAKNLERIGDHAANIAEDVIYLVQARTSATMSSTSASSIRFLPGPSPRASPETPMSLSSFVRIGSRDTAA
jgi:phosphate uptake regulator